MRRYSLKDQRHVESPAIDAFLAEVWEVSKKHGLALSHEDGHGAFEVVEIDRGDFDWLMAAHDATRST